MLCVGLFGTCGGSKWRKPFMELYEEKGIEFFNPQVDDWTPDCAVEEAKHLAEDQVILFPVTGESYGLGSIAETGFSILNAIKLDDRRDFVIMVEQDLAEELKEENEACAKESLRGRALVLQHIKKLNFSNVYLVETLEDMLAVSLTLWEAARIRQEADKLRKPWA